METTSGHRVEQIGRLSHPDPAVRFLPTQTAPRGRARRCPGASRPGAAGGGHPRGPGPPTAEPWSGDPTSAIDPGPSPWDALPGNPGPAPVCTSGGRVIRGQIGGGGGRQGEPGNPSKAGPPAVAGSVPGNHPRRGGRPPPLPREGGTGPPPGAPGASAARGEPPPPATPKAGLAHEAGPPSQGFRVGTPR